MIRVTLKKNGWQCVEYSKSVLLEIYTENVLIKSTTFSTFVYPKTQNSTQINSFYFLFNCIIFMKTLNSILALKEPLIIFFLLYYTVLYKARYHFRQIPFVLSKQQKLRHDLCTVVSYSRKLSYAILTCQYAPHF